MPVATKHGTASSISATRLLKGICRNKVYVFKIEKIARFVCPLNINISNRGFKLGVDWVPEKPNYDHVGVKSMIFYDDDAWVKDEIKKARRALKAFAGLGIKKNGLTMRTC